jgi:hypothetical protein
MMSEKKRWCAASVILVVQFKSGRQRTFPVWENVYLIAARSTEEARRRAEALGRAEENLEGLTWKGKPAKMVFGGVRKVVFCAADPAVRGGHAVTKLYDGVELTYSSMMLKSAADLDALIRGKPVTVVYEE